MCFFGFRENFIRGLDYLYFLTYDINFADRYVTRCILKFWWCYLRCDPVNEISWKMKFEKKGCNFGQTVAKIEFLIFE